MHHKEDEMMNKRIDKQINFSPLRAGGVRILKNKIAGGIMFSITVAAILLVVLIGIGLYIKSVPVF